MFLKFSKKGLMSNNFTNEKTNFSNKVFNYIMEVVCLKERQFINFKKLLKA